MFYLIPLYPISKIRKFGLSKVFCPGFLSAYRLRRFYFDKYDVVCKIESL